MIFTPSKLEGVFEIFLEPRVDERGMFARIFCIEEFDKQGIVFKSV